MEGALQGHREIGNKLVILSQGVGQTGGDVLGTSATCMTVEQTEEVSFNRRVSGVASNGSEILPYLR